MFLLLSLSRLWHLILICLIFIFVIFTNYLFLYVDFSIKCFGVFFQIFFSNLPLPCQYILYFVLSLCVVCSSNVYMLVFYVIVLLCSFYFYYIILFQHFNYEANALYMFAFFPLLDIVSNFPQLIISNSCLSGLANVQECPWMLLYRAL